jgi:hypothetical protein
MENPGQGPSVNEEKLAVEIERFSKLSSDMIALLSSLSREINKSVADLQEIRSAVELKKQELQSLREIENSAADLEQQLRELQREKESLEQMVVDQRGAWEREKERRAREEREYVENLNFRRQQEEQEVSQMLAAEHGKARQQLEDELRAIQQQNRDAQEAAEKDFHERELILRKKELEWGQLIQELEEFLYKLDRRHRLNNAVHAVLQDEEKIEESIPTISDPLSSDNLHDEPVFYEAGDESRRELYSEENSTWGDAGANQGAAPFDSEPIFGRDWSEEPKHSSSRRETAPLKFPPKKPTGFKPED